MTVTSYTNTTFEELADVIAGLDDFVVCGHVSPDGDCLGSATGLVAALRACGKTATPLIQGTLPESFRFLPGADSIVAAADFSGEMGCFIAVDAPDLKRLGVAAAELHEKAPVTLRVDHHAIDRRFSDYCYTDPDAVSASTLVWELAGALGAQTKNVATCCYTGLLTDSGGFKFQNTDARAFRCAAEMVAAGADPVSIPEEVFGNDSLVMLDMEMRALRHLFVNWQKGYAVTYLTEADYAEFGASSADCEGVVNAIRRIKGVNLLCFAREHEGNVKLSFRSKAGVNVRVIAAEQFGGGGHDAAAGATVQGTLAEVMPRLITAFEKVCK